MSYISGKSIRELREKRKLTQRQLAEQLSVSDKTISKWETGKGLPDIGIIEELAAVLKVSVAELFAGEFALNQNRACNMKKTRFYVCPVCGNVITSAGEGAYSCCGILLPALETEEDSEEESTLPEHIIHLETVEQEYFIRLEHEMTKEHSISFFAYVTSDRVEIVKLYPEQNAECYFGRHGHGWVYVYCNKHGLFRVNV